MRDIAWAFAGLIVAGWLAVALGFHPLTIAIIAAFGAAMGVGTPDDPLVTPARIVLATIGGCLMLRAVALAIGESLAN